MKKFTEILSFIVTAVFILGGLFLAICAVGVGMELVSYSPSSNFEELLITIFMPFIIAVVVFIGLSAIFTIGSGLSAFHLIKTANEKFDGDENKTKRIILKCVAYGLLIISLIPFAKLFL